MILSDELKHVIKIVSLDLNIPEPVIEVVYRTYWKFVRDFFSALPLKELETEEEFDALQTSINLPSLGKMYTTWDKIEKYKRRREYADNLFKNKNKDK